MYYEEEHLLPNSWSGLKLQQIRFESFSFLSITQEKLFSRKRTIRVTHRSQNIENSWAFLSFKVDMTFTLNDIDLQMTLTFK